MDFIIEIKYFLEKLLNYRTKNKELTHLFTYIYKYYTNVNRTHKIIHRLIYIYIHRHKPKTLHNPLNNKFEKII